MTGSKPDSMPTFKRPRFVCPHPDCGAFAQQSWTMVVRRAGSSGYVEHTLPLQFDSEVPSGDPDDAARWYAAECGSCEQMSLWLDERMVFPSQDWLGEPAHADLPPQVADLYAEAASVAPRSRRAGAALARAAVEKLLRHLDPDAPKSASLEKRIERIIPQVSSRLQKQLQLVRVTGNGAVHIDDEPESIVLLMLDDDEGPALLEILLDTVNQLTEELITRPRVVETLFDQLPEKVRAKYAEQP
ncbi:DUF4145 domain-containing protein [Amycolatopsis sp. SID8362]|uniref:DUF4145 domain-containing protein n=1 Tax=Amycolatopsis sp. SID8362 TaxID=2690346 RepID=UPI00136D1632|nr:DUF4145 domain-containing protein [Amycolatopsis sp. SID8362]NBH03488.1 DUF4145 domain-containing protein [Amycolatopsis sp. SID8362]NED40188.1 DUF4145 domain-containing protein [Amycolatopsis sp. SID8362]